MVVTETLPSPQSLKRSLSGPSQKTLATPFSEEKPAALHMPCGALPPAGPCCDLLTNDPSLFLCSGYCVLLPQLLLFIFSASYEVLPQGRVCSWPDLVFPSLGGISDCLSRAKLFPNGLSLPSPPALPLPVSVQFNLPLLHQAANDSSTWFSSLFL